MRRVCLHGFTGTPAVWDPVAPGAGLALSGHAPALPVLPGWCFADEVARLAAAIDATGTTPVHLIGYSLGGRLALHLALSRPDLVARLSLISAHPGLDDHDADARAQRRAADEAWSALLERHGIAAFVSAWEEQPLWHSQRALPPAALAAQRSARLSHDPAQLAAALRALGLAAMPGTWPRLSRLSVPTTFITGSLDTRYTDLSRRAAQLIPGARTTVIPGAGHNLVLERPHDMRRILS